MLWVSEKIRDFINYTEFLKHISILDVLDVRHILEQYNICGLTQLILHMYIYESKLLKLKFNFFSSLCNYSFLTLKFTMRGYIKRKNYKPSIWNVKQKLIYIYIKSHKIITKSEVGVNKLFEHSQKCTVVLFFINVNCKLIE